MPRLRVGDVEYLSIAIPTVYWMPGEDFLQIIVRSVKDLARDGDLIVLSEKAISIATGNIVDEKNIEPRPLARLIGGIWMTIVWGHLLGRICHLKPKTIQRLREYPQPEGPKHKEITLNHAGLLQSLRHGSEGGIDGSNVAFSYVTLPLQDPNKIAENLHEEISKKLEQKVGVSIVDTDMTYSIGSFHFTPRPNPLKGIYSIGGVFSYIIGRMLKLKPRATPLAIVGWDASVEEALNIAELTHHSRKDGAGKTVWDMAERFGTDLTSVTWEMLNSVKHCPIVLVRKRATSTLKPTNKIDVKG
ncbi:MAG: coenzyme F420-0:L-glutamate ligase [Candidatus Bathyarchaeota archaeon]|nr:MAG: coenzyme F420-0:L-glutamate ligase [Candidatus Bathyarchaeota archaeon]